MGTHNPADETGNVSSVDLNPLFITLSQPSSVAEQLWLKSGGIIINTAGFNVAWQEQGTQDRGSPRPLGSSSFII